MLEAEEGGDPVVCVGGDGEVCFVLFVVREGEELLDFLVVGFDAEGVAEVG